MLIALAFAIAHIKIIDFYGVRNVPRASLERALDLREGDPLPESKEGVEERLAAVPGVRAAHVGAVCCYDGGYVLWIGIEENGAPRLTFRKPPNGSATLPADIDKS